MKKFYLSAICLIGMVVTLVLGVISGHGLWFILSVILFALGLNIKSLLKIFRIKMSAKPIQKTLVVKKEEPAYKKIVREYKLNLSLVDTPEKAMMNFGKCLILFQSICDCRGSGVDKYSIEYTLKTYRDMSIEAYYRDPENPNMGIRARLSVPNTKKVYEGYSFHVPVLTTGDHLSSTQDIFDLFVSQFIQEGLVVKFNL